MPIARQLRHAISNMVTGPGYCAIHGVPEPGPAYLMCFECGHVFPTAAALLADHAALAEAVMLEPKTDPEEIHVCPHCAHDF